MGKKKKSNDTRGFATTSIPSKKESDVNNDVPPTPKPKKSKWYKPPKEPAPLKSMEELKELQKKQKELLKTVQVEDAESKNANDVDELVRKINLLDLKVQRQLVKSEYTGNARPKIVFKVDKKIENEILMYLIKKEVPLDWFEVSSEDLGNGVQLLWHNYCTLLEAGFAEAVIKKAMQVTGGYNKDTLIDYICIQFDPKDLPRYISDKHYKIIGHEKETTRDDESDASDQEQLLSDNSDSKSQSEDSKSVASAADSEVIIGMSDAFLNKAASSKPKTQTVEFLNLEYTETKKKSPKQLLLDTVVRQFKQSSVKFQATPVSGGGHASSVCIKDSKSKILVDCVFPDNFRARTAKEAEHFVATMALYELFKHTSMYTLLPRVYADFWVQWRDESKQSKVTEDQQTLIDRYEFVSELHKRNIEATNAVISAKRGDFNNDISLQQRKPSSKLSSRHSKGWSEEQFYSTWTGRKRSPQYNSMLTKRAKLPVYAYREQILELILTHKVCIVSGATGSGKSTQVGQFILEDALDTKRATTCNVICVEPRRISTMSLAYRVASEMGESARCLGQNGSFVGYQIRFNSLKSASTLLTFCTAGVALRMFESDPNLTKVSHIIIDEVHERSLDSDMLLALLKKAQNQALKIILMSATGDVDSLRAYFGTMGVVPCIDVPGKTFPVDRFYLEDAVDKCGYLCSLDSEYAYVPKRRTVRRLGAVKVTGKSGNTDSVELDFSETDSEDENLRTEGAHPDVDPAMLTNDALKDTTRATLRNMNFDIVNYDLVVQLIGTIVKQRDAADGAILVFLSGHAEITKLFTMLTNTSFKHQIAVYPLHSEVAPEAQSLVFEPPPNNKRKVVLSTNIAETGVTIPDVVYVIDSGRVKEQVYNKSKRVAEFKENYISKANSTQRCGRAGRVRPGVAYCLYTRKRFESFDDFPLPEMLRVSLETPALRVLLTALKQQKSETSVKQVEQFFSETLSKPNPHVVKDTIQRLIDYGTVDARSGELTPLGCHVAHLPMNIQPAKMLIYGLIFGCLEPMLVMAASDSCTSSVFRYRTFNMQYSSISPARHIKNAFGVEHSDQLATLRAYEAFQRVKQVNEAQVYQFCESNFINRESVEMLEYLREKFIVQLSEIDFVDSKADLAKYNTNSNNIGVIKLVLTLALYPDVAERVGKRDGSLSLVFAGNKKARLSSKSVLKRSTIPHALYLYQSLMQRNDVLTVDGLTKAPILALFVASSRIKIESISAKVVSLDDKIILNVWPKTLAIMRRLRNILSKILQSKIETPTVDIRAEAQQVSELLSAMI